jgi:predicted dehydrogenase
MSERVVRTTSVRTALRPRLGFLGIGWIGRHRLTAIAQSGTAEIAAIVDPAPDMAARAKAVAPGAVLMSSFDELLKGGIDGVVIATPSALHAQQATAALEQGVAVFCQKPLGRTASETRRVVAAACAADRLLAVDLSYRFITEMQEIRELIRAGQLGDVYAVDLVFHNAYGPDKPWFYDPKLSGGGCVIDLGIHLVDLALWALDFPRVTSVSSRLYAAGKVLQEQADRVEDYAVARLDLDSGTTVRLACSWKLHGGCDAIIEASFYGTQGGAALHNVNGSFYHFTAERLHGTARAVLSKPHEKEWEWGGRAAVDWARRLAAGDGFDPEVERLVDVAAALDRIYGR